MNHAFDDKLQIQVHFLRNFYNAWHQRTYGGAKIDQPIYLVKISPYVLFKLLKTSSIHLKSKLHLNI